MHLAVDGFDQDVRSGRGREWTMTFSTAHRPRVLLIRSVMTVMCHERHAGATVLCFSNRFLYNNIIPLQTRPNNNVRPPPLSPLNLVRRLNLVQCHFLGPEYASYEPTAQHRMIFFFFFYYLVCVRLYLITYRTPAHGPPRENLYDVVRIIHRKNFTYDSYRMSTDKLLLMGSTTVIQPNIIKSQDCN